MLKISDQSINSPVKDIKKLDRFKLAKITKW